jgi:oligoribonuclease NrnB/cAMP/cGMP phosphodiesterase (DHH superfamily)
MKDYKIVIYFHNDPDGVTSGAIALKYYKEQGYENVECRKINYNYNFEKEYNYLKENDVDELVILDFCFPEEYMNKFHRVIANNNIIWVDHHPIIDKIKLDSEIRGLRSKDNAGCVLTWKYYYPNKDENEIVLYIEDLDLWNWRWTNTKPFINYFDMKCKTPEDVLSYFQFEDIDGYEINKFIEQGKVLLEAQAVRIKKAFEQGRDIMFHGHKTRSCNSSNDVSQVGEYCYKDKEYPIGMIWQIVGKNIIVGLRSNSINVGTIATSYKNGGGHKFASGFVLPITKENLDLVLFGDN